MSYNDVNDVISYNAEACIGCNFCTEVCVVDAITVKKSWLEVGGGTGGPLYGPTHIKMFIDPDECIGSGICASVCPTYAIIAHKQDSGTNPPGGTAGGGGGSSSPPDDPNDPDDPCEKTKAATSLATALANESKFKQGLNDVKILDGKEHGVVFGSVNGVFESTAVQHGSAHSVNLQHSYNLPVASLHYHTNNNHPSSVGDIYSLIGAYNDFNSYSTFYITSPNGSVYAIAVTDPSAMSQFLTDYPPSYSINPDGSTAVNFPQPLNDLYHDVAFDYNSNTQVSYEVAMAYMLDTYNVGIALMKMDSSGNFQKLGTNKSTAADGSPKYEQTKCP
ncbi:hypothetical protein IX39_12120 [Chryseobacterium formosense]|uniref:4Fe-4S ferredoxin-type domain-containing protein n=1 Tax=Chryseobacterium formosense TaxID=236814 RepID=A0A085ZA58_9FLAO|nr:4Fe-4S dicluster domain-containing protein [Chryseobacterium formosense]KFF01322.1 hypothetical protein IX39_12120 [Chryseobacterium formosense]SFT45604.1 4Fe-4S dicluster domain-containing protein [Chryseobacterium formosense]